jgi:hypothetical protein
MRDMSKNHFNGRTMHIDISRRFYQKGDSGIAFKVIPSKEHKGIAISNKLKNELKRDFCIEKDYAKLSAICIYYLIVDDLDSFDNLVICNDEEYCVVKENLDFLFKSNKGYSSKFITSLSKLRDITGDPKIRSYADKVANIYRRKVLKPLRRRQKGVNLNIVEINYQKIKNKLEELNKKE